MNNFKIECVKLLKQLAFKNAIHDMGNWEGEEK